MPNGGQEPSSVSTSETSGGVLPNGQIVDLIVNEVSGRVELLWLEGTRYCSGDRIQTPMGTFVPVPIDPAILRATVLPTKASPHGTAPKLFADVQSVFSEWGFSQDVAIASALAIFPTWFQNPSLPTVCVTITGPCAEAMLLLQLFGCMVRRPLWMSEIGSHGLPAALRNFHPTVLIDARHYSRQELRKLVAASTPGSHVPWNGSSGESSFSKVVYLGAVPAQDVAADFSVQIHVTPSRHVIPILGEEQRERIIKTLQPRLSDYYFRKLPRVRASEFDLPGLDSEARITARLLGRCFDGAPEIQAHVQQVIEDREAEFRAARWIDETCVVIEALLDTCHDPKTDFIYVGKIAQKASLILNKRGVRAELKARKVGAILDDPLFARDRQGPGYRFALTDTIARTIHCLARDYRVAAVEAGISQCSMCKEIFQTAANETTPKWSRVRTIVST